MRVTHAVGSLALSLLFAAPQLAAQVDPPQQAANAGAPAAPQLATEVRVASGALQGKILTAGERLPLAAHSMTLLAGGKPLQTVVTAADGAYHTAPLQPGSYSLMVRDDLQLDLVVADGAPTKVLDILVPQVQKKTETSAQPQRLVPLDPKRDAAASGSGPVRKQATGIGTWAVIGAGLAVAVAIPTVASHRDKGPNPVSPVQPSNGGISR